MGATPSSRTEVSARETSWMPSRGPVFLYGSTVKELVSKLIDGKIEESPLTDLYCLMRLSIPLNNIFRFLSFSPLTLSHLCPLNILFFAAYSRVPSSAPATCLNSAFPSHAMGFIHTCSKAFSKSFFSGRTSLRTVFALCGFPPNLVLAITAASSKLSVVGWGAFGPGGRRYIVPDSFAFLTRSAWRRLDMAGGAQRPVRGFSRGRKGLGRRWVVTEMIGSEGAGRGPNFDTCFRRLLNCCKRKVLIACTAAILRTMAVYSWRGSSRHKFQMCNNNIRLVRYSQTVDC